MSGNDIQFATSVPEKTASGSHLRLRTWFDHTRNMMMVEVINDPPKAASSDAGE